MKNIIKKYIGIALVLFLCCALLLWYNLSASKPRKIAQSIITQLTLTPVYLPDISIIPYPVVSVKPTDKLYFTTLIKEALDSFSDKFTPLFIADKRLAEAQKWGDELQILHVFKKDSVTVDDLITWWNKQKYISWGNTTIYGSWESELARYAIDIKKYQLTVADISAKASLASTLLRDREDLETTFIALNKTPEDTTYIKNLIHAVFTPLLATLDIPPSAYDPYHIIYPLDPVKSINQYGIYDISMNVSPQIATMSALTLNVNDKSYKVGDRLNTDYSDRSTLIFHDIHISSSVDHVTLTVGDNIGYTPTIWQKVPTDHSVYKNAYQNILNNPLADMQYLLHFNEDIKEKSLITIIMEYTDSVTGEKKGFTVYQDETPLHSATHYVKFSTSVKNAIKTRFTITVQSSKTLAKDQLDNYKISIVPIIAPSLLLSYDSQKNTNIPASIIVNEPTNLSLKKLLLKISALLALVSFVVFIFLHLNIEAKLYYWFSHKVRRIMTSGRKILLCSLLLLICADFITLDKRFDVVIMTGWLCWISLIIGYSIPASFNFFLSGVLFFPYVVFQLLNHTVIAEKMAIYIYIFFVTGMLQSAHRMLRNKLIAEDVEKLEEESSRFIMFFLNQLYLLALLCKRTIMKAVHAYFTIPPKSDYDRKMNLLKAGILVLVLCMTAATGILTIKYIKAEIRKKQREDQNPVIVKVEPTIVYRATKILIKGRNLGWNENGNVKLMNGTQEVVPDVWTDTRIIFTVPLQWKVGINNIRIEKKIFWEGQEITAVSKSIPIKLINAGSTFTPDDDAYFEQLKHIDPEVLKLNGYESNEQK